MRNRCSAGGKNDLRGFTAFSLSAVRSSHGQREKQKKKKKRGGPGFGPCSGLTVHYSRHVSWPRSWRTPSTRDRVHSYRHVTVSSRRLSPCCGCSPFLLLLRALLWGQSCRTLRLTSLLLLRLLPSVDNFQRLRKKVPWTHRCGSGRRGRG